MVYKKMKKMIVSAAPRCFAAECVGVGARRGVLVRHILHVFVYLADRYANKCFPRYRRTCTVYEQYLCIGSRKRDRAMEQ